MSASVSVRELVSSHLRKGPLPYLNDRLFVHVRDLSVFSEASIARQGARF